MTYMSVVETIINIIIVIALICMPLLCLSMYKVTIPCLGCDKGGTFHKCKEGTGYGSKMCSDFEQGEQLVNDIKNKYTEIKNKVDNLDEILKKPFIQTKEELENIANKIKITVPEVPIPDIGLPTLSCEVTIPVIDQKINPCSLLNDPIASQIKLINTAFKEISDKINSILSKLTVVFDPILGSLKDQLTKILEDIQKPWLDVKNELGVLKDAIIDLTDSLRGNVFKMILYYIASFLQKIFPFASIASLMVIAAIILLIPFLGGYYGFLRMLFDIANVLTFPFFGFGSSDESSVATKTSIQTPASTSNFQPGYSMSSPNYSYM